MRHASPITGRDRCLCLCASPKTLDTYDPAKSSILLIAIGIPTATVVRLGLHVVSLAW